MFGIPPSYKSPFDGFMFSIYAFSSDHDLHSPPIRFTTCKISNIRSLNIRLQGIQTFMGHHTFKRLKTKLMKSLLFKYKMGKTIRRLNFVGGSVIRVEASHIPGLNSSWGEP